MDNEDCLRRNPQKPGESSSSANAAAVDSAKGIKRKTFSEQQAEKHLKLEQKYRTADAPTKPQALDGQLELEREMSDPKQLKNIIEEPHESETPFDPANTSSNWSNQELDTSLNTSQLNTS